MGSANYPKYPVKTFTNSYIEQSYGVEVLRAARIKVGDGVSIGRRWSRNTNYLKLEELQ